MLRHISSSAECPQTKHLPVFFWEGGWVVEEHKNKLTGLHSSGAGDTASACSMDMHMDDM